MGSRLARIVVRRPGLVLAAALAVAGGCVPLLARLRLDADLIGLVPSDAPATAAFVRYGRTFASEQPLVALVACDDPARLESFAGRFGDALAALPEIASTRVRLGARSADLIQAHLVDLLDGPEIARAAALGTPEALEARARRMRSLVAAPGGSALVPLFERDPLGLLELAAKRLEAGQQVDATSGYFKSADGKWLLLFAQPKGDAFDVEADRALVAAASSAARGLGATVADDGRFAPPGATPQVGFTGTYAHAFVYRDYLHRDMEVSTIVSGVAVLLFFALLLGAIRALPMVALPLLYGLALTGAAAGAIYGHVNAVSLAFGTILLSIGIDLPIQIYNRLREELESRPPKEALERTIARLAGPALLATLGPAVVFFACALSRYRGLAELGVLAGVGLILNLVSMLTVLPAIFALTPHRIWAPARRPPRAGAWFARFGRLTARRPRRVLAVVGAVALAAVPLAGRLEFERHPITSAEPQSMAPVKVQREMERHFGEQQQALIVLSEGTPAGALEAADGWRDEAERLRAAGLLTSYQSIAALFPSPARQRARRAELTSRGFDGARAAHDLGAALDRVGFDTKPFAAALDRLAHPPPPVTLDDAGPELAFLVRAHVHDLPSGERLVATYLAPAPGRLDEVAAALEARALAHPGSGAVTGRPLLERTLRGVVVRDTVRLSIASVGGVVLLLALYYRRARPVLAVVGPLSVAWVLFGAALAAAGLPLNLFNLLAVPLVIGYGIDDHVFLVHRYLEDRSAGPERALASTGRAIVVTSLSTMAGFAGLAAARFDGLRMLGISGALAVGLCLLAAMAVLPALLSLLWPPEATPLAPAADSAQE